MIAHARGGAAASIPATVIGDVTGLSIPAHPAALREGGAAFLTRAFHAFGSLPRDNAVSRILLCELCPGGSTGKKLFLSVAYAQPDPALHAELFVKFSRDFDDQVRDDRGKHEMAGEVKLAGVSRRADFPITVCRAYFADHEAASRTGLLITERIRFGTDGIEPHHPKCMDHLLDDPLDHYRTILTALARIAAAHHAGRLGPAIEATFPHDAEAAAAADPMPYDAAALRDRVRGFASFAAAHPQLYPAAIASPALFAAMERHVGRFAAHDAAIRRFLQSDPRMIALCHWNANIDNVWFWRDAGDRLRCGLMDWGHAGRMNLAFAVWGSLSGAEADLWNAHGDALLALFVDELAAGGGPRITVADLALHLDLHVARMGLSYFLDSPARIAHRLPDYAAMTGPRDPRLLANETARNQLGISTTFLNLWARRDLGASLDRMVARVGELE